MSPQDVPPNFADLQHHGSLFTLFLHSPLTALCFICNVGDVAIHHWERCQGYVDRFITEASRLFSRCRVDDIEQGSGIMDSSYVQFFGDDFLRTLILRFVFCDVTLRLHRGFRGRHQRPRCEPPLPNLELLEHPSLGHIVLQLASCLDVRGCFSEAQDIQDWYLNPVVITSLLFIVTSPSMIIIPIIISIVTSLLLLVSSSNKNLSLLIPPLLHSSRLNSYYTIITSVFLSHFPVNIKHKIINYFI